VQVMGVHPATTTNNRTIEHTHAHFEKNNFRYATRSAGDGAYDVPKPTDDVDVILPTPRDNVVEEEDSTALALVE